MKTGLLILGAALVIAALQFLNNMYREQTQFPDSQSASSSSSLDTANERVTTSSSGNLNSDAHQRTASDSPQQTITDLATKESLIRLRMNQAEEALLELDPLLENYDDLESDEKFTLINGYANYYLAQGDLTTVVELYEAALGFEALSVQDRLLLNRTLGQLSLHLNRIDRGVAYFDDYFALGGEIDSAVSLTLARTHNSVGDASETLYYLDRHLQLINEEGRDLNSALYARSYSQFEELLFLTEDQSMAIEIATNLARTFDRVEPWKNLAELYELNGQTANYNEVLDLAESRGYYAAGEWRLEETLQN